MKNDGGSAFPFPAGAGSTGMSMRDYFAAAALQGILVNGNYDGSTTAQYAYEYADAMLKERDK